MVNTDCKNESYPYEINKDIFIEQARQIASGFFIDNFTKVIQSIRTSFDISRKETPSKLKASIEVYFDDSTANFLNIVHGGSIAILFENIINVLLYYFTKKSYVTISSKITYKSQIYLNTKYLITTEIDKLQFKTVFIEGTITEQNALKTISDLYPIIDMMTDIIPSASASFIKEVNVMSINSFKA